MRLRRGKKRWLRDWHKPLPDGVSKQLDQAVNYFSNSVRVPAALIAGQAGNMLYRLTDLPAVQRSSAAASQHPLTEASRRNSIYVARFMALLLLTGYTVCA